MQVSKKSAFFNAECKKREKCSFPTNKDYKRTLIFAAFFVDDQFLCDFFFSIDNLLTLKSFLFCC